MAKILTIYFSRKGENYVNGNIISLKKGNTEIAAEFIRSAVGGDIFQIDTVKPYDDNYYACVEESKAELRENARPELKEYPNNIEDYDIIFVGYPNWCGTMPMPVFALLEKHDLSGKTIAPFCSNEGSGMGNSERDLAKICKNSNLVKGLSIHGAKTMELESTIKDWAKNAIQQ